MATSGQVAVNGVALLAVSDLMRAMTDGFPMCRYQKTE